MNLDNIPGIPDNSGRFTDDEREMPLEAFVGKLCFRTGIQNEALLEAYNVWLIHLELLKVIPNGGNGHGEPWPEITIFKNLGSPIFNNTETATPQQPVALRCGSESGVK